MAEGALVLPMLDAPVPLVVEQPVQVLKFLDIPLPDVEQKCSQEIHDRRTGSRAVLLCTNLEKALRHLSSPGVTSRIVLCWPSPRVLGSAISLSVPTTRRVFWLSAHSEQCDRSCLNRAL